MLFEVVLPLEGLAADFAGVRDIILVGALVDHEVVGLGEPALAVAADELALGPHFASEFPGGVAFLSVYWHYGEHWSEESRCLSSAFRGGNKLEGGFTP